MHICPKTYDHYGTTTQFLGLDLVWFLFYGPSTHFRSFWAWSVTLTTLFLGKPPRHLPVLSAHSFASNWQLLSLKQRKRENGSRNFFLTKSPRKNVPDVGIKLGAACMPSGHPSDRATVTGFSALRNLATFKKLSSRFWYQNIFLYSN